MGRFIGSDPTSRIAASFALVTTAQIIFGGVQEGQRQPDSSILSQAEAGVLYTAQTDLKILKAAGAVATGLFQEDTVRSVTVYGKDIQAGSPLTKEDTPSTETNDAYAPQKSWGYESGDLSAWNNIHAASDNQPTVVTDIVRDGFTHSAKFVAKPGKKPQWHTDPTSERTEVVASQEATGTPEEGTEQWYWWSTYFDKDVQVTEGDWMIYTQWHQTEDSGNPNIAFHVVPGKEPRLELDMLGGDPAKDKRWSGSWDAGKLEQGTWNDHLMYIKWSSNPEEGRVGLWINGEEKIAPSTPAANLYNSGGPDGGPQSAYLKQGIYRGATDQDNTVYFSDMMRGSTKESVLKYLP